MISHRKVCHMFCFLHPDRFEEHSSPKPFKSQGAECPFTDIIIRHNTICCSIMGRRLFCRSFYWFKQGNIHGIEFFKACMNSLYLKRNFILSYHVHAVKQLNKIRNTVNSSNGLTGTSANTSGIWLQGCTRLEFAMHEKACMKPKTERNASSNKIISLLEISKGKILLS